MVLQLTQDEAMALEGLKQKGITVSDLNSYFKIYHIYQIHMANPELTKTQLREKAGSTQLMINRYWNIFVEPKPVYVIKDWYSVICEK